MCGLHAGLRFSFAFAAREGRLEKSRPHVPLAHAQARQPAANQGVPSRELKRAVALFASAIMLGTVLLLVSVVVHERDAAAERAWDETYNLSGAFEEQVRRVIDSVRGSMSLLKPRLGGRGRGLRPCRIGSRMHPSSRKRLSGCVRRCGRQARKHLAATATRSQSISQTGSIFACT